MLEKRWCEIERLEPVERLNGESSGMEGSGEKGNRGGGRGKKKEENGESNREMNPRGRKKVENEKSRQRSPYCWKGLN